MVRVSKVRRGGPDLGSLGRAASMAVAALMLCIPTAIRLLDRGISLSSDSIVYVTGARNILDGQGYLLFDGTANTLWPPLYPTILAGSSLGLTDPLNVTAIVSVVHLFAIALLTIVIARRLRVGLAGGVLCAAMAVWSAPIALMSSFAWSEQTFTVLVLCLALLLTGQRRMWLVGAVAAAATLTRYLGAVLPVAAFAVVLSERGPIPKRLARASIMGFAWAIPVGLWLARNATSGEVTGARSPSSIGIVENAGDAFSAIAQLWWSDLGPAAFAASALLIGLVAAGWSFARRDVEPSSGGSSLPVWAVLIILLAGLVLSASLVSVDQIDQRFIAPLVPLIAILVFAGAARVIERSGLRAARLLTVSIVAAMTIASSTQGLRLLGAPPTFDDYGDDRWRRSPTMAWLGENRGDERVVSNFPDIVFFRTGIDASFAPQKTYRSSASAVPVAAVVRAAREHPTWLVWFKLDRPAMYEIEFLMDVLDLQPIAKLPDGVVFTVGTVSG